MALKLPTLEEDRNPGAHPHGESCSCISEGRNYELVPSVLTLLETVYGNYHRESDDLHAVVQRFFEENHQVIAIVGHRKGLQLINNLVLTSERKKCYVFCILLSNWLLKMVLAWGNVVLIFASECNDVHTVINISSRFNLGKGIESRLGKDLLGRIKANGFIDVKE
ncbi:hypothetical protein RJ641_022424 [Dillenia turbinata]|uniref:Uncharacterized protein n=1 Tax=Dillenia turbinata TaxID=194707 RepID=A0AAN8ULI4_9MAGN